MQRPGVRRITHFLPREFLRVLPQYSACGNGLTSIISWLARGGQGQPGDPTILKYLMEELDARAFGVCGGDPGYPQDQVFGISVDNSRRGGNVAIV